MRINKHDTNGTKPLLGKGELGYDDYTAGGDTGRVFVGTGTENIAQAKKAEVVAVDGKVNTHIARSDNPHSVTKAQVGLGSADNTSDAVKNVLSATKWTTPRTITLSGDVTGSVSIDGSANVGIVSTVVDNSHDHTIANVTGLQTSLDSKVNSTEKGSANGVAILDANGKITLTQMPDSVLGQLEYQGVWDFTTLPTATQKGQYWIASVSGNGYVVGDWAVWNGVSLDKVDNTDAVASVAGRTGNVVLTKSDVGLDLVDNTSDVNKNVLSATKLTTTRNIALTGDVTGNINFDGSANVSIATTIAPNSVALGTDTTGNYVAGNTAGTGITVTGTAGEGWSPTISIDSTVATLTGAQTLTNKTLQDSTTFIVDTTDATKKVQFDVAGVTTATTRTLTIPNVNGTIVTTGDTGTVTSTMIADGTIVNADINASAGIVDTKLATISTAGKVLNSATTATNLNTAGTIVARDARGDFTAGIITAALSGNASTATTLQTARTLTIGSTGKTFDGSANVSWSLAEIGAQAAGSYQPLDTDLTAIAALAGTSGLLKKTAADTWTLDTNSYVTSSGVTSVTGTAPIISSGDATPAISISAATTSSAGSMSAADKTKLDGVATGATANTGTVTSIATTGAITGGTITTTGTISHSTADGYLHVPATGTTNNGKVLTAGATAGSLSWSTIPAGITDHTLLSNIGTNTHAQIDTALTRLANTSGTNTGDNAVNSNYVNDYRASNFVAGTNYLAPNGSAAALTNFPTLNQNTTGTASNVTGVVAVANGGTGSSTALVQGGIVYGSSATAYGTTTAGTSGYILSSNGSSAPTWVENTLLAFPGSAFKKSARVATTAALTLNAATATIDGVTLTATDRVLIKNQATASQNGIYTGVTTTTWTRTTDSDSSSNIASAVVAIDEGTANGGRLFTNIFKATDTLGTTDMAWYEVVYNSGTWAISTTGSAATLTTGRTIGMTGDVTWTSASFNGSANVTGVATLANTGVVAGTYKSVTTDAKGRITGGTNPTTISGFGITDAYTKTETDISISTAISNLVATAPATLDTLNELAAALGNDPSFATTVTNNIATKVQKVASTDNAIVRFDGATGQVQDSSIRIDDNGNLNITGVGKRITGDFSNTTDSSRVSFESNVLNSYTVVNAFPNGTGPLSAFRAFNTQSGLNSSFTEVYCDSAQSMVRAGRSGTGSYLPMTFNTNGAERMRIDTSGNVLVTGSGGLGYGTGSGGTVTQLTSKSTLVTLNKPSGQITMNNASLAAGASVTFTLNNNLVSRTNGDTLYVTQIGGTTLNYRVESVTENTATYITVTNKSAGALSEAIQLNFNLIKGAVS